MLGDLFGDEDEGFGLQDSSQAAAIEANVSKHSYERRPPHCAADMNAPSDPRQASNLVGLLNQ